jgi:hypothetical protein
MHFRGIKVGKIIETVEDLIAHSYPLLVKPRETKPAPKSVAPAPKAKVAIPPPPPVVEDAEEIDLAVAVEGSEKSEV